MNIQEALKTNHYVKRPHWDYQSFCYYLPNTGPYKDLVECDYFCFYEDGFLSFSTSMPDLYAQDVLADDFEIAQISESEIIEAYKKSELMK